jgi:DNA-binding NarL/FixJ family response regulator
MIGKIKTLQSSTALIADSQALVVEAFQRLLSLKIDVAGTATDGYELIRLARKLRPDIIISEISLPKINGLDACIKILGILPSIRIIFLTNHKDPDLIAKAIQSGARGYLLKSATLSELLQAIRAVHAGGTYITPMAAEGVIHSLVTGGKQKRYDKLTPRQRQILRLLSEGNTMKQIASVLYISPRTVAFHKYRIMASLGIENNAQLIKFAMKNDLEAA